LAAHAEQAGDHVHSSDHLAALDRQQRHGLRVVLRSRVLKKGPDLFGRYPANLVRVGPRSSQLGRAKFPRRMT